MAQHFLSVNLVSTCDLSNPPSTDLNSYLLLDLLKSNFTVYNIYCLPYTAAESRSSPFFLSFQYRPQHPLWWNWRVSYSTMTLDSMAIVKHHISFRTSYYHSHSLDVVITVADTSVSCYLLQHTVTIWSLSHFICIQHVFLIHRSDIMHYVIAFYKIYHYWAVSQIILSWTLLIQPPSTMAELVDCYSSTSVYCCA